MYKIPPEMRGSIASSRTKGIEFIDLHSIFKDYLVISSIPNYLNDFETPIICYKYIKKNN